MLVDTGKDTIKRYFARQEPSIATMIAVGVGSAAESVNNIRLQYEVTRVPVTGVSADLINNKIIFKGILPLGAISTIYEVGLINGIDATLDSSRSLGIVNTFANWTNGTLVTTNSRIGGQTVKIDYIANGTTNAELGEFNEDLSVFGSGDSFLLAFHAGSNLSSVRVRVGTDASNYFEFVVASPTAGYNIHRLSLSSATVTGTPSWENIVYLAVRPSATAGGAGSIWLDGIRFETLQGSLTARKVLSPVVTVDRDVESDIEYALAISV